MGGIEIALAKILLLVLAHFHIISYENNTKLPLVASNWDSLNPIFLLVATTFLATIFRYILQILPSSAHYSLEMRIRNALVRSIMEISPEIASLTMSEATYISTTLLQKTGSFAYILVTMLSSLASLAFIGITLIHISWQLTIIIMVGLGLSGIPIMILKRINAPITDKIYEKQRNYAGSFLKFIRNSQYLKISGLETSEADRLFQSSYHAMTSQRTYTLILGLGNNLPFLMGTMVIVLVLIINSHYAFVTAATLVPFIYLLNRLAGSVSLLSSTSGSISEMIPYVRGLLNYLNVLFPLPIADSNSKTSVSIDSEISTLSVHDLMIGRADALTSPIGFHAQSGDTLLITGTSGKGKTTLLLTLIGLVAPISGTIAWNGAPLAEVDPKDLRSRVGYAGPEPYLLNDTIQANLLFGLSPDQVSDSDLEMAISLACADFVYELEGSLSHELKDNGDGISAGQKQRLSIARCILRKPEILLLDEATANIDEETERLIMERVRGHMPRVIILAVSHRASLRPFASKILEL